MSSGGADASISFTTVVLNEARCTPFDCPSGGGLDNLFSFMTVKNSVVAQNNGGDCTGAAGFAVAGANLDSDGTCPGFTMPAANAAFLPLFDNGGPTRTHMLWLNSPAIDVALGCTDIAGNPVLIDQRGHVRPEGPTCDLGAFEVDPGAFVTAQALLDALASFNIKLSPNLIGPLHELVKLLGDDNFRNLSAVCNKVDAFLRQLDVVERRGDLSRAQAARLRELAGRLQDETGCTAVERTPRR